MVTVLMPMAGLGTRFSAAGETRPKPLIDVLGLPMFQFAIGSVRKHLAGARLVCVTLSEHQRHGDICDRIAAAEPSAEIVSLPKVTRGALETCLAASGSVEARTGPLIVLDCDLAFEAPRYFEQLGRIQDGASDLEGLLLSFRSDDPRYSYAEVSDGVVVRTAEKVVISDRALLGAYAFSSAERFFDLAREVVDQGELAKGEFYVSTAFNHLVARGARVGIVDAERHWSLGTPAELEQSLADPAFGAHALQIAAIHAQTGAPRSTDLAHPRRGRGPGARAATNAAANGLNRSPQESRT